MKNALIVTAHPNIDSYNFALSQQAKTQLQRLDWQVSTSALHQMNFNPAMGTHDYPTLPENHQGTIAQNQLYALEHQLFCEQIDTEQTKLKQADLVILQFPIWWGSFPAMLKGWIERVCSYGFAYGPAKQLAGKQVLLSVTTGGAANESECQFYLDKITTIADEVFGYMLMKIAAPHFVHGPSSLNSVSRKQSLEHYAQHVQALVTSMMVGVNAIEDETTET